jgi:predicted transcriptional regulator
MPVLDEEIDEGLADLIAGHFFGHTNSKWVKWRHYTNG